MRTRRGPGRRSGAGGGARRLRRPGDARGAGPARPAERVAFVLHDLFAVPFDQIAPIVDRTPVATKKLASRARHRVRGATTVPGAELARQRRVVEAFLAASRNGDLDALLAVLAPDVVRRADRAALPPDRETVVRGRGRRGAGDAGVRAASRGSPNRRWSTARSVPWSPRTAGCCSPSPSPWWDDRVAEYDVIADPARLRQLDLAVLVPA